MGVHNNSLVNALRGVRERVFAVDHGGGKFGPPPQPRRGLFKMRLADFRRRVLHRLGSCTPWTQREFVESYKGSKRIRYERAITSLQARELSRRDSHIRAFVKAEAINFTAKPDPAPRIIQPRDPRYNVLVGPYIKPLEHRIYAAIGKVFGGPTVMKGYNARETAANIVAAWGQFNDPVGVLLDASRFDQHVSHSALKWEHSVYNAAYRSVELGLLLRWQLRNYGSVTTRDGSFRYKTRGCRMSGDMNTALGNCLIMCAMVHAYLGELGLHGRLINNGDDCVVIIERQYLRRFQASISQWFLEMGFTMTCDGVASRIEEIEFCQTRPVKTGAGWVMCRSPFVGIAKDTLNKSPDMGHPLRGYLRWAYQVGTAGGALASGVPVFQAAYAAMRRIGVKCAKVQGFGDMSSGFEHMASRMVLEVAPVTTEARVSFWRAWDISPHKQELIEEYFNTLQAPDHVEAVKSWANHLGNTLLQQA
ncbi:hypothetical protein 2 [Changjiang tombus-like virus 4]|uniref:hypothetical protein 2 n=1 Tax=Changjiang tombus-like virus 4 TaxID=1922818 RepID=UPI00090CBDAF|nr:hypothetical protein 2 [Changjiang tombus-like virus 4]APG76244.1 hypothetical protein 2 [Changjiang tombus-like virus 4]